MTLDQAALGSGVFLISLNNKEPLKARLMDLGFVPGSFIRPLFAAPCGDPRAYEIRNTVIALRQKDAEKMEVS